MSIALNVDVPIFYYGQPGPATKCTATTERYKSATAWGIDANNPQSRTLVLGWDADAAREHETSSNGVASRGAVPGDIGIAIGRRLRDFLCLGHISWTSRPGFRKPRVAIVVGQRHPRGVND